MKGIFLYLILVLLVLMPFTISIIYAPEIANFFSYINDPALKRNGINVLQQLLLGPFLILLLVLVYFIRYRKGFRLMSTVALSLSTVTVIYALSFGVYKIYYISGNTIFQDHRGYPIGLILTLVVVALVLLTFVAYKHEKRN